MNKQTWQQKLHTTFANYILHQGPCVSTSFSNCSIFWGEWLKYEWSNLSISASGTGRRCWGSGERNSPDDAELEAVVSAALNDGRVTHLHCGRVCAAEVLLLLNGLFYRLGQFTVTHFLLRTRQNAQTNKDGCNMWQALITITVFHEEGFNNRFKRLP